MYVYIVYIYMYCMYVTIGMWTLCIQCIYTYVHIYVSVCMYTEAMWLDQQLSYIHIDATVGEGNGELFVKNDGCKCLLRIWTWEMLHINPSLWTYTVNIHECSNCESM